MADILMGLLPVNSGKITVDNEEITEKNIKSPVKQKKKPKVEVVYINYRNIVGSWGYYKYFDWKDIC